MDWVFDVVFAVLLLGGAFFAFTGALGLLRLPDFYSRMHPAGKNETLAQTLIMTGLVFLALRHHSFGLLPALKLILVTAFTYITAPTAIHAIAKSAYVDGLRPWQKKEANEN